MPSNIYIVVYIFVIIGPIWTKKIFHHFKCYILCHICQKRAVILPRGHSFSLSTIYISYSLYCNNNIWSLFIFVTYLKLQASNMKNDLVDFKNNINDMKSSLPNTLIQLRNSLENLVDADDDSDPIVTFPDDTPVPSEVSSPTNTLDTLKFEQKTMNNFTHTKVSA